MSEDHLALFGDVRAAAGEYLDGANALSAALDGLAEVPLPAIMAEFGLAKTTAYRLKRGHLPTVATAEQLAIGWGTV